MSGKAEKSKLGRVYGHGPFCNARSKRGVLGEQNATCCGCPFYPAYGAWLCGFALFRKAGERLFRGIVSVFKNGQCRGIMVYATAKQGEAGQYVVEDAFPFALHTQECGHVKQNTMQRCCTQDMQNIQRFRSKYALYAKLPQHDCIGSSGFIIRGYDENWYHGNLMMFFWRIVHYSLQNQIVRLTAYIPRRYPLENHWFCREKHDTSRTMPKHSRICNTPAIMLQGTSSNAGKSVLTAALCRILLQDGLSVAPFKAQNMALNSFVTPDGREIGRAQAVQATACRLEPDVRMNPVLLKPSSDTGSQVIVMGHAVGNMRVKEYVAFKPEAFRTVQTAYDSLAAEHDVMVIEGAGSPAEINLKAHDIVNMQMARYADARVLLVGDIDRGGVFASLVGTMELLDPWERDLVAGFILNRFRGDASLLDPALEFTTNKTGKPFFGVVPNISVLGLPEEDSVSFKEAMGKTGVLRKDCVDIALIDLPHIANFTDFDALAGEPDVHIRGIRTPEELGQPDCIILPGSKNTPGDLAWLRRTGLADAITALAGVSSAPEIVGICGGLQLLGKTVDDPLHVESVEHEEGSAGLGLLAVHTMMGEQKVLTRVAGRHVGLDMPVSGYEIHHGQTQIVSSGDVRPCVVLEDGSAIGFSDVRGLVWGTYLHGVFDADGFRRRFVDGLRTRKGLVPMGRIMAPYSIEPALDHLADVVRAALDMKTVYRLLGLSPAR